MKQNNKEPELEKIPLAIIYVDDGIIKADFPKDRDRIYELFGFLKCLVNSLEEELTDQIGKDYEKE